MRAITDEAGVSAQTVYDSVGSKRVLVGPLNDLIDTEAGIRELAASIDAAEHSRDILVTQAAITRSILEHCGDIVIALLSAPQPTRQSTGAASMMFERGRLDHVGFTVPDEAALTEVRHRLLAVGASSEEIRPLGPGSASRSRRTARVTRSSPSPSTAESPYETYRRRRRTPIRARRCATTADACVSARGARARQSGRSIAGR